MNLSDLPSKYQQQVIAQIGKTAGSMTDMERKFQAMWEQLGGPQLEFQYRPINGRKFAIDFSHLQTKVAIELEGGIWMTTENGHGKGHAHPKRFKSDCVKYNLLTLNGWKLFRLATGMIKPQYIEPIINFINENS